MGCEIWQEDLPQNQTHHTHCCILPNAFFHKRQSCINNAHLRLKSFRQITKYPACGSSLCIVRLVPKNAGKTAWNTSQLLPLLWVQSIPLNTIPNYNFSFPADTTLLCWDIKISQCTSLLAIRISLVMSPPHLSISPSPPPSLQKSSFRLGVKLDPIMLLLFPDFQW